ncbi:hypothetical protein L484_023940 [Morus notabilis]|uniref:Uncharacterized protein n=1 Tax=Morus notabilis TaxID=981085 RepID=W9RNT1_9ROSA|nr:hypothetical protein L484_023940 [Morus notabilis]
MELISKGHKDFTSAEHNQSDPKQKDSPESGHGGAYVNFEEVKKNHRFCLTCTIDAAFRLSDTLDIIGKFEAGQGFKRKFTNSSMTILVEILANVGGEFLKILKVQNGVVRNLFLPGDGSKSGWGTMKVKLDAILGRDSRASSSIRMGNGRGTRKEETFKEAAMNRGKVVNAEGHQIRSLARGNHDKDFCNITSAPKFKTLEHQSL